MNRSTLSAFMFLVGLATLVAGCGNGQASVALEPAEEAAVPVEAAYPGRADIFATYDATAVIDTDGDASAFAKVPGEIVELLVEEGDRVAEGQVLARLDGERLRLEMIAARAELDKARGEYERYLDLNRRGLVSEAMFEGLKYDLEALSATYDLRKLNFGYSSIRAPIAGIVSERLVKLGQNVTTSDAAFRITDTRELLAYLQIPQSELSKFTAGHAATLRVDSMPNERFSGSIVRISPTIDRQNGTFRATVIVDNHAGRLVPGMFARFRIAYEKHADAMTIPVQALIQEDDQASVYVVDNGSVLRRRIETGIVSGGRVEVLDGLSENEQVVIVGHSTLRDGSKVLASIAESDEGVGG